MAVSHAGAHVLLQTAQTVTAMFAGVYKLELSNLASNIRLHVTQPCSKAAQCCGIEADALMDRRTLCLLLWN